MITHSELIESFEQKNHRELIRACLKTQYYLASICLDINNSEALAQAHCETLEHAQSAISVLSSALLPYLEQ